MASGDDANPGPVPDLVPFPDLSVPRDVAAPFDQAVEPTREFIDISLGGNTSCALWDDHTAVCWGAGPHSGPGAGPPGTFEQIATAGSTVCGLRTSGRMECYGLDGATEAPSGVFVEITAGYHLCGRQSDGTVACTSLWATRTSFDGPLLQVDAGGWSTCGLRNANWAVCLGAAPEPSDGPFVSLRVGGHHVCGLRVDGSVSCLADGGATATPPSSMRFVQLSAGGTTTCGMLTDPPGQVVCWDTRAEVEAPGPPAGARFRAFDSGGNHSCGILTSGKIVCWGDNTHGQCDPPSR